MEILIVLLVWVLLDQQSTPARPPAPPPPPPGDPDDLGIFKPVLNLPGVAQAYAVLKPVEDKVVRPLVKRLNNSAPVKAINAAVGGGEVVNTRNPDGTVTRKVQNPSWMTRHFSEPTSRAFTAIGHEIESWF